MNELRFYKEDFEDEVRRSLQIYDRPLTEKDALLISSLVNLEHLRLIDVTIPNLKFMRSLPNEMALELCGVNILDSVDLEELRRFKECDLDEIEINGERVI